MTFQINVSRFKRGSIRGRTISTSFDNRRVVDGRAIPYTILLYSFRLTVGKGVLKYVYKSTTMFTFLARSITLMALLMESATNSNSLLNLTSYISRAFPVLLLLRNSFSPLTGETVMSLQNNLVIIVYRVVSSERLGFIEGSRQGIQYRAVIRACTVMV